MSSFLPYSRVSISQRQISSVDFREAVRSLWSRVSVAVTFPRKRDQGLPQDPAVCAVSGNLES
jgi:hypothetical protein